MQYRQRNMEVVAGLLNVFLFSRDFDNLAVLSKLLQIKMIDRRLFALHRREAIMEEVCNDYVPCTLAWVELG